MALSKKDLIAAIDQQNGRYRLDKVKIVTPDHSYKGTGVLECKERLRISITLPKGTEGPAASGGIVSRENFWRLEGVLEDSMTVSVERLAPFHEKNSSNGIHTLVFDADELDIAPHSSDRMTSRQISKMLSARRPKQSAASSGPAATKEPKAKPEHHATFFAVLKGYKLIAHNQGTDIVETNDFLGKSSRSSQDTYAGTLPAWKYGLIQVKDDVHVHLRSETRHRANDMADDRRHFDAFLKAIAFAHGQHAWPSQIEYRSDHKLLINRLKCIRNVSGTPHTPFSERMWFNGHLGQIQWDLADPLQRAFQFFLSNSELSKEIDELLYLFREAAENEVPLRVSLLTICTLYESLMRSAYRHGPPDREESPEIVAFNRLKTETLTRLKKRKAKSLGAKAAALSRLSGIVASASSESIREIVEAVTAELWENSPLDWKAIHKEWTTYRNPLSHKITGSPGEEKDFRGELLAVSRIAGAINAIILKLMGYSGMARISTFEDGYKAI
jgi:hypothetical protein